MRSVKKFVFFLALFCLFITLFHREIIGGALKYVVNHKTHSQISYRAMYFEDGNLIFKDLSFLDPAFKLYAEKASVAFDFSSFPELLKGKIHLQAPHVTGLKKESLSFEKSWFDFDVDVGHGTIDWGGLAHFSLQKNKERTYLTLDWDGSSVLVNINENKIDVQLERFNLPLFKSEFPWAEITEGKVSGTLCLEKSKELISANLVLENGKVAGPNTELTHLKGAVSYNASLGGKWVFDGLGVTQNKQLPFELEGRLFFNSHWLETDLTFQDASVHLEKNENWKVVADTLNPLEISLIQGFALQFYPELKSYEVGKGNVSFAAIVNQPDWDFTIDAHSLELKKEGESVEIAKVFGSLNQDGGDLSIQLSEGNLNLKGLWEDFEGVLEHQDSWARFIGGFDGEKIPIQIQEAQYGELTYSGGGWIDLNFDLFFSLEGDLAFLDKKIPFQCPILAKSKDQWLFDFRLTRESWDLLRLVGSYDGKELIQYDPKSHFLGASLKSEKTKFTDLNLSCTLLWDNILALGPTLKQWDLDFSSFPRIDQTQVELELKNGKIQLHAQSNQPSFELLAIKENDEWLIDLDSDLTLQAQLSLDGKAKGCFKYQSLMSAVFDGKITPELNCEFSLSKAFFDFELLKDDRLKGSVSGTGHIIYNGQIESDFDLTPKELMLQGHSMENDGEIHLNYSSIKGAQFKGVNLHGPFDCIIDILQYEKKRASWVLHNAQIHIPASFLSGRVLEFIDRDKDLNFAANLDFAADFSTCVCTMREGLIPHQGTYHRIENLKLLWEQSKCFSSFQYLDQSIQAVVTIDEDVFGRVIIGSESSPMTIDWKYSDHLTIHSVEGAFGGIDASFHAEEPNVLVGSAHVNFHTLSELLPEEIGSVFEEIKMGNGYELKGRLDLRKTLPHFHGILSGKAIELFGFQFRTLLAQVDLAPDLIHLFDLKISDSAGMLKVDEVLIEGRGGDPFTINIPNLSIVDLRPSFLVRPGEKMGPIEPLVVRELQMRGFKGRLEEGITWKAEGELNFINSYKREETVFDLPANLLSRIAGLDLELLIPVCGDLKFELKDGYFNLLELTNSYSEGKRTEFFLEMEPQPRMDLDGNLEIYIKMKQFVLLKFTESFFISIDGVLDDPQFHLKKKKFLGIF